MGSWLLFILACQTPAPEPAADGASSAAPAATAPAAPATPSAPAAAVSPALGEAWGAVFWRDSKAVRLGGGEVGLGPKGAGRLVATAGGAAGACGVPLDSAPEHAVLALPAGKTATVPDPAPANQASTVERAAWRLDELMPARDAFSPAATSPDPALQRGMRVASVVKTRRTGAPPVLVASATRDCVAVVAALDREASKALSWDRLDKVCEPLALLPAADYDGDGTRELAAYGEHRVVLYRVVEAPGTFALERMHDWTCE